MRVECPYCNKDAELVNGDAIYPHRPDLHALKFWLCRPCNVWTGTHSNSPTHKPRGSLATPEIRKARGEAHFWFDGQRRRLGINRRAAYAWLREQLGVDHTPHIGFMDEAQCARVVELCRR
jgi:hypothetical protein